MAVAPRLEDPPVTQKRLGESRVQRKSGGPEYLKTRAPQTPRCQRSWGALCPQEVSEPSAGHHRSPGPSTARSQGHSPSGTEAKLTVLSNWKTKSIRRLWTSTALPAQTPGCPHSPCHRSTGDCPQNPVSTSRLVLKIVSTGYTS